MRTYLRIFVNCFKRFGVLLGLRIGIKLLFSFGETHISLPDYPEKIIVRQGTSDIEVFEKVLVNEEYQSHLNQPETIVDLGANVGYASIFFAVRYPESQIIAVEPEPSNFAQLQRNIAAYPNITAIQKAVWPSSEPVRIGDQTAEKWQFQIEQAQPGDGGLVETVTMPELITRFEKKAIDILKIDIESAEKQLFESNASTWLDSVNLIIIELHDNLQSGCSQAFYGALANRDFDQYIVGENVFVALDLSYPRSRLANNQNAVSSANHSQAAFLDEQVALTP